MPFVLAHTGVRHHSGSVHTSPRERWLAGDRAVIDAYTEIAGSGPRGETGAVSPADCEKSGVC